MLQWICGHQDIVVVAQYLFTAMDLYACLLHECEGAGDADRVSQILGKEWDSDCSSSDSDDEGLAASAFDKSSLFPNERHTCLMAKEKKVSVRNTSKYTTSDDDSSDDEVDYTDLFKGLDRDKIDKINELIDALNEKDRLLEKQEDILYEEHDKFVSVQKSLALEIKRNEIVGDHN